MMRPRLQIFLLFLSCRGSADVDVSCVFRESCVLPCPFTPGDDPVIHWTKEPEDAPVHIYFKNQHQLHIQHENYTGRTSLSDHGIRTGDASLQLHKVKVSDEGRYNCYVGTIRPDNDKLSFVNLKVYAPVLGVSVRQEGQELICRAEKIYPEPTVDWTPLSSDSDQTQTSKTEDGLYSVYSSVRLPPSSTAQRVTCTISTSYSWRNDTITPQGVNETCVLNETCTLQIPADRPVKQFFCLIGRDEVPVAFYPTDRQLHQHKDFKNRTSVFLEQPGRGVVLQIRRVQEIHQGGYTCEVSFSSGNPTKHWINLTVLHSPNTQQTPAPNSTPTVAPPLAPDRSHLQYLWFLSIPVIALAVGLAVGLYVWRRKILNELQRQTQRPYDSVPQAPPGDSSTQQNGHQNGLNKANGLQNGECDTGV